jgi:hypothetical protein
MDSARGASDEFPDQAMGRHHHLHSPPTGDRPRDALAACTEQGLFLNKRNFDAYGSAGNIYLYEQQVGAMDRVATPRRRS